uniref:Selenocysteine lyase n=1 Tax=Crassostrea virginica TaxID=6565 RepID=A0A8B8E7H5_CRAVI|nr:selenocysteine lyase-like isoform X2 [Crassostrea virginica]
MDEKESSTDGMAQRIYLDNNATTPLELDVKEAITSALSKAWGNPSSSHTQGIEAKAIIEESRQYVAEMLGAKASDMIFNSGGTEGNNMILQTGVKYFHSNRHCINNGSMEKDHLPHFITSNLEHDAVKLVLEHFAEEGIASVTFVPASSKTGHVMVDDVIAAIRPSTCMISLMLANNETGIIQPVKEIFERVKQINTSRKSVPKILLHTDAAQAIGKIPVNVQDLGADYLTVVGHKFYGPRIGAIYVKDLGSGKEVPLYPMFYGGGQERNYRPGTENTAMIAGLGQASKLVTENIDKYNKHMQKIRDYLEERLKGEFGDGVCFNGRIGTSCRIPNTCNVSFLSVDCTGSEVLSNCKLVQASIGAACHSQNRPSPILLALDIEETVARRAIRLSVGRETTQEDIDKAVNDLKQAVKKIQNRNGGLSPQFVEY